VRLVRLSWAVCLGSSLILFAGGHLAAAQDLIPDAATCAGCTITIRDIVTLADDPRAHMPGPPQRMIVDGRGRYWLTYAGGNTIPILYGPDGSFLRDLGPRGDGPGEFQRPVFAVPLPGDSVLVYESRRDAFLVLAPDLSVRRTINGAGGPYSVSVFEWPDLVFRKLPARGEMLAPGRVRQIARPFALLDLSGQTARALQDFGEGRDWGIASADPYSVWTWDYHPYRIQRWSRSRVLMNDVERRPSWFPTGYAEGEPPGPRRGETPPAHLAGAVQDSAGRIWVFVNEPMAVWPVGAASLGSEMHKYFRTRVEIIDPMAKRLIASVPLEGWVVAPLPGMRAAMYGTTAQGTPYVRIVQLSLVQ
jgi:hypothetical protein